MDDVSIFGLILQGCYSILNIQFTIFGYTLSLWNLFAYTAIVGTIAWAVWNIIDPD